MATVSSTARARTTEVPVTQRKPAPDQNERDAAVFERERNVLIDAGAGTGKTTILVNRLVEMVAPRTGAVAIPIKRLAAITFTRKAAGELRLKIREQLLAALAEPGLAAERDTRLRAALADLDTAYVSTIHSFADRLLRLRPIEAQLSPGYEIAEDDDELVRATWELLVHGVENNTLAAELAGTPAAAHADEAARTIALAIAAGLRAEEREGEWRTDYGLDSLVRGFVRHRDVPPDDVEPAALDTTEFRRAVEALVAVAKPVRGTSPGARWIRDTADFLARLRGEHDPAVLFQHVLRATQRKPRGRVTKRDTFDGDDLAWKAWQRITGKSKGDEPALLDTLRAPLDRWMATRLARLFPVVLALYEKVKARRQVLDQLDLLVKLRNLIRDHREVRGEFQQLFDHVFVDEFQDTDPLQAEIVLFLCEREPRAAKWDDVVLRNGALTLVGDPKQSIYRFRRADVAVYDRVRQVVARGPHLTVTLSANFRSVPALIQWVNDRFDTILGTSPDGQPFDPATGTVYHQRLIPGRGGEATRPVHVLSVEFPDARKRTVDAYRALEGEALARYLRWLVEASDVRIEDPLDGRRRRVQYGDVAILAVSTWRLSLLFPWLDAADIPYASRGGTLFLEDPLSRQFLLGLRALADRDDGVAEAALLRPPFFALDPTDLLLEREAWRADGADIPHEDAVRRVHEARELIRGLRRQRLDRPPGATARDLLDHTAFARAVALGPNGTQRLSRLRELCFVLEERAARESLDYDAVTARVRDWVASPPRLDPPHPVGAEAVQILTVHQAKGLEFPVVVLWDGQGQWEARLQDEPWRMERDGRGWTLAVDGVGWEEPAGLELRKTERAYLLAERRRVAYVAVTRARDLLVVPRSTKSGDATGSTKSGDARTGAARSAAARATAANAGGAKAGKIICADLLAGADASRMLELAPYRHGAGAPWVSEIPAPAARTPVDGTALEQEVDGWWHPAVADAARPRFKPVSVSAEAHAMAEEEDETERAARKLRAGRFGHVFGSAVHQAIGLLLHDPALGATEAARLGASRTGLTERLDDVAADVARAWQALQAEGLARRPGADLQVEYPVAGPREGGVLLSGYIDLVSASDDRLDVLDFKTDPPPAGAVETDYPAYAAQVRLYGELLSAAGIARDRQLRCGLLFTADGVIRWVTVNTGDWLGSR